MAVCVCVRACLKPLREHVGGNNNKKEPFRCPVSYYEDRVDIKAEGCNARAPGGFGTRQIKFIWERFSSGRGGGRRWWNLDGGVERGDGRGRTISVISDFIADLNGRLYAGQ